MTGRPVAVVTGASRGAGKGIALALGEAGYTVYVTGRTRHEGDAPLPGTVSGTAEEIECRGGHGIPVVCDHADDAQVAALFAQVADEQGRLDVLVNNAYVVPDHLTDKGPFWSKPLDLAVSFDVGLRSSYVSSYYAAPLLVAEHEGVPRGGLVVNTSSFGGRCYMHGPVYGAVKAGVDKMAHDMAVDFKSYGVAAVSVWMGLLRTERTKDALANYGPLAETAESPEFTGRVIAALAADPDRMTWSGQTLIGAELGAHYGVHDITGKAPVSHRAFLGDPTGWNPAVVD